MNNYYKYKESHLKAQKRWKENNPDKVKAYAKKKYEKIKLYKKTFDNWNSLREYTEQRLKVLEKRINTFGSCNPDKDTKVLQIYREYLDKMNELEGKDKNEISSVRA